MMKLKTLTPVAVVLAAVSGGATAGGFNAMPVDAPVILDHEGGCGAMGGKPGDSAAPTAVPPAKDTDAGKAVRAGEGTCGAEMSAKSDKKPAKYKKSVKEGKCGEGACGAHHGRRGAAANDQPDVKK